MKYVNLGKAGVKVSRICLGTMNLGWKFTPDQKDSFAVMNAALEAGINFFDTADGYGQPKGNTEEFIGDWLKDSPSRRDQIVLATKVYAPLSKSVNNKGLSAYHIKRACENSLRRLKTDHIDLYQMHHIDRAVPMEEIWQAMEQLIREGKISYVGTSNFASWHLVTACLTARERNLLGPVSEQSSYNLNARAIEQELLPAARHNGIGVLAYGPLAGSLLSGFFEKKDSNITSGRNGNPWHLKQYAKFEVKTREYESFCKQIGMKPAEVALAWVLKNRDITCAIAGPRTPEQILDAARISELSLDDSVLEKLDQMFPGPGISPECYAW